MGSVSLKLNDGEGKLFAVVSGIFIPEDIASFELFIAAMARVRGTTLLTRGIPSITNFKWSAAGMEFTSDAYSNVELYELLHVLRHVILDKEKASFTNISKLLEKRFKSDEFTGHINALRNLFENGELSSYMQITIGDQHLFDSSLLRIWLNGTQYHSDEAKAAAWAELESRIRSDNARALVMNQLHGRVKALFMLEHVVHLIMSKVINNSDADANLLKNSTTRENTK
jgi:hypothetical protein